MTSQTLARLTTKTTTRKASGPNLYSNNHVEKLVQLGGNDQDDDQATAAEAEARHPYRYLPSLKRTLENYNLGARAQQETNHRLIYINTRSAPPPNECWPNLFL